MLCWLSLVHLYKLSEFKTHKGPCQEYKNRKRSSAIPPTFASPAGVPLKSRKAVPSYSLVLVPVLAFSLEWTKD